MKLFHSRTVKDMFGVFDVTVTVNDKKEYTFSMKSEYDVNQFLGELKRHPGKALNYLKKNCIPRKE
jgi:hypothetical protein